MNAATTARVNVQNGSIEHLGRPFHRLEDGGFPGLYKGEPRPPTSITEDALSDISSSYGGKLEILVRQNLHEGLLPCLTVDYAVVARNTIITTIGPMWTVQSICRNQGLVPCERTQRRRGPPLVCDGARGIQSILHKALASSDALELYASPHVEVEIQGRHVHFCWGDLAPNLLAAYNVWDPIIQTDECLACCVRAATDRRSSWTDFWVICSGPFISETRSTSSASEVGSITSWSDYQSR